MVRRFASIFTIVLSMSVISDIVLAEEYLIYARIGPKGKMYFDPQEIEIKSGDKVTWINDTNIFHNIKTTRTDIPSGAEAFSSSGLSAKGSSWSYIFTVPGKYKYFCAPHKSFNMVGTIIVK